MTTRRDPASAAPAPGWRVSAFAVLMTGAALCGAGVVAVLPRSDAGEYAPAHKVIRLFDHPDPMAFTVNPMVERGHKTALITFKFSYRADEQDVYGELLPQRDDIAERDPELLGPVPKLIRFNWDRAYSRCLEMLTNQRVETLMDPRGKLLIKRMLQDELTAALFPDGMARVDDILWTKFVVQ